jgi:outer membrane receptor protein involved in Fe transport
MMQRSFVLLLAGTSLAAVATEASAADAADTAASAQASVEQANPAAADSSQDIIVTAQKRPQVLLDVPQSISVITGDKLEQQHAQRLSDFLTKIPSANVVESQTGLSRIVLRGINTGGVGATVATYIDEAPFGSATSLANGAVDVPDLDPFDLERVEVLRGPQGTLYGANSLGGLVKYVTVAPQPGVFDGAAEVGIEDVHHGDIGWWGRAAGNFSLGSNAAIRASGFYRSDPGYIDDPHLGRDVNDGETYGGRVSLLFQPTSALRIRASALAQNIRSNGTNTVDLDPVTLKPTVCDLCHLRLIPEPNDIDYRLYHATIDYDFGPVSLVSATSYGTLDQTLAVDASGVYGPHLTAGLGIPLGAGLDQGMKQRRFTQEVRLSSSGVAPFEWTFGGFYTHEKNRLSQNLFGILDPTGDPIAALDGLVVVDLPSTYEEEAVFANATWHIAPKFDLTAGGRYSHNHQTVVQNTSGLLAGGDASFDGESSDNVFTYSVAPSFAPNKHTRIYARVAKGYRPGGPNAVSPLAPAGVPRSFGPDTTTNYEVGIKSETAGHRLAFEVTAFMIDWKDIQLLAQVENFGVNTNGGSARSKGIEFNVSVRPVPELSLYANGAYVDAYLTRDAPVIVGGLRGDSLPYNPKFSSTIGAEYDHPLSATMTGHAGMNWHYTGRRRSDFDATVGQKRLKAFGQVDAHIGVDIDRFAIDAFVHNLTDSRGIVNLGTFGAAPSGDYEASVVRPRTIGVSLRVKY